MTAAFFRFHIVGIVGFLVQLGVLLALEDAGLPIALATALAVEASVLHNFAWHERWTWAGMTTGTRRGRLARFHVSNGLVSLAGNTLLTTALTHAGVPLVLASLASVLACAAVNFATAHLWVFCAKTWPTLHGHLQ